MTAPGVPDPGTRPPGVPLPPISGIGAAVAAGINPTGIDGVLNQATAGVRNVDQVLTAAQAWVSDRHNWTRVIWFGAGVICFAVGAAMLARGPAAKVMSVAPTGQAVKLAGKALK